MPGSAGCCRRWSTAEPRPRRGSVTAAGSRPPAGPRSAAELTPITADRGLAPATVELRRVLRAGALPAAGRAHVRRARALRHMRGEAPREHDVGFEGDADD